MSRYNTPTLFDIDKFEKLNSADEEAVITDLETEFPKIINIHRNSYNNTVLSVKEMNQNKITKLSHCQRMNENVRGGIIEEYSMGNVKIAPNDVFYLDWLGKYKIYFKKLNENFHPSYNMTIKSEKRLYQTKEHKNDTRPILYFGFIVDKNWTVFTGSYLVKIDNNELVFKIDLIEHCRLKQNIKPVERKPIEIKVSAKQKLKKKSI